MTEPILTILVPNYRTLKLTKLCLRLLRKYTDPSQVRVLVIDNDSGDESLDYLRELSWIDLIERKAEPDDTPALSHSRALDMALERVTTPYVLSIHTDTLFKRPDAIDMLLSEMRKDPAIAGVGSWKLEPPPSFIKRLGKALEYSWRGPLYRLRGDKRKAEEVERQRNSGYYSLFGRGASTLESKDYYYLRSHCALYRMDLIRKYGLTFSPDTAGKVMHRTLVERGHRMIFLSSEYLVEYISHINHATMMLHPQLGSRRKNVVKGTRRIKRELEKIGADAILAEDALDR